MQGTSTRGSLVKRKRMARWGCGVGRVVSERMRRLGGTRGHEAEELLEGASDGGLPFGEVGVGVETEDSGGAVEEVGVEGFGGEVGHGGLRGGG